MSPNRVLLVPCLAALLAAASVPAASAEPLRFTGFTLDQPGKPWRPKSIGEHGADFASRDGRWMMIIREGCADTVIRDLPGFLERRWSVDRREPTATLQVLRDTMWIDTTFGPAVRQDDLLRQSGQKDPAKVVVTTAGRTYYLLHPESRLHYLLVTVRSFAPGKGVAPPPSDEHFAFLRTLARRPLAEGLEHFQFVPWPVAAVRHGDDLWVACTTPGSRSATHLEPVSGENPPRLLRLDAESGRERSSTLLRREPTAIAIADSALWVASEDAGMLDRFDAASGARLAGTMLRTWPHRLAASEGMLWVGHRQPGAISRVELGGDSATVRSFGVDAGTASSAGRQGTTGAGMGESESRGISSAICVDDSIALVGTDQGWLSARRVAGGEVLWTRKLAGGVGGLLPDQGTVWVATGGDTVLHVGTATGEVILRLITPARRRPAGPMALAHGLLWVAMTDGTVCRWDAGSGEPVGAPTFVGSGPTSIVGAERGVWVTCRESRSLARVVSSPEPVPASEPGAPPGGATPATGSWWERQAVSGVGYTQPQRFYLTFGVLWSRQGPGVLLPPGYSVQAELGASGGSLGAGICRVSEDSGFMLGATLRAKVLRTWGSPLDFGRDETLAGVEVTAYPIFCRLGIGYLWPMDAKRSATPDGAWFVSFGAGF